MIVYFKEVGQGDSIILEWNDNNEFKIGIIDCNKKEKNNPVLDHLKLKSDFLIEFIILSHPHEDHFSGLLELLEYCSDNKIKINYFLHTCASKKEYLQYSVRSISDTKLLTEIFRKADQMNKNGEIVNFGFVNDLTGELALGNSIKLKVISPSNIEYTKFNQKAFKNTTTFNNNPDSNFLSTVIKIYTEEWFALFTSDATYDVFWRLNRAGLKISQPNFLFGQIPHHGSVKNYYQTFWRLINHSEKTQAAISVGQNSYGHPSKTVINDLQQNSYKIKLTNSDNSLSEENQHELSATLDLISERIGVQSSDNISKDIIFKIHNNILLNV